MKEYDIYLFDFDFTLADSGDGIAKCFQQVFKKHGYNSVRDDDIKKTIGIPLRECYEILADVHDAATLDVWCAEFEDYVDDYMIPNTPLFPNTEGMLKRLKAAGKKTAVISTKMRDQVVKTMERFDILKYIDLLIAVEDVPIPKPNPAGILRAMETLGGTRENTLYTGDSDIDANAAKNAGLDFVAAATGTTPKESLYALPHIRIIDDIGQLF